MTVEDEFTKRDENNGRTTIIYHNDKRLCAIHRTASMTQATQEYILGVALARLANLGSVPKPKNIPEFRAQLRAALRSAQSSRARLNADFIVDGLQHDNWLTA